MNHEELSDTIGDWFWIILKAIILLVILGVVAAWGVKEIIRVSGGS